MKSEQIKQLTQELENKIYEKGYQSLQYVLFDNQNTKPFAVHIFYKGNLFMVNSRDERSDVIGKTFEFDNFPDAENKFFRILDFVVREGRRDVEKRGSYMYSSPLWDKAGT